MSVYTIQRDPPWQQSPSPQPHVRSSYATTASHYSQDEDLDMVEIQPLRVLKSQHKQMRPSRLPIFKQVRSMLNRPLTNPAQQDQDPESATVAFRAAYETSANLPSGNTNTARSQSLVSSLDDDDLYPSSPPQFDHQLPVSPISASPPLHYVREHKMRPLQIHVPSMPKTPVPTMIKRKPAPGRLSLASQANPSTPQDQGAYDFFIKGSHFSWTTGARSPTSTLPPSEYWPADDRDSFQTPRSCSLPEPDVIPNSRFSWTSVGTSLTHQTRPDTPPPIPTKYRTPPVKKSILSRHRPVQRMGRDQWAPPRKTSLLGAVSSPRSSRSKIDMTSPSVDTGLAKKLPPPPLDDVSPRTHLESLQREEEDKVHQRKNVQHAISELSKIQNASPMDVPFAHVRDAQRKLVELRATLSEIELEEREIGIAISRARRKEGEEEGLWVRRVTG